MKEQEHPQTPYKVPRQKRSRRSLERILEAAEQQIRAGGLESLTISGVVSSVGLSVGAFYARFPHKTALIHAVQNRFHERLEPAIRAEIAQETAGCTDLAQAVEAAFGVLIRKVTGERELSRAFMSLSVFDPVLRAKGEAVNRERREALAEALLNFREEIGHPDPRLAIDVAYGIYAAVVRGRLVFGEHHELLYGIDNATLYSELITALTLYLKGAGPLAQGADQSPSGPEGPTSQEQPGPR
jgi:AcrR family transcriptional regulator